VAEEVLKDFLLLKVGSSSLLLVGVLTNPSNSSGFFDRCCFFLVAGKKWSSSRHIFRSSSIFLPEYLLNKSMFPEFFSLREGFVECR
jgi:hypothetical protein